MHFNYLYLIEFLESKIAGGGKGLDFGCGDGMLVEAARKRNLDAYGADIFGISGKGAAKKETVKKLGFYGNYIREITEGSLDFSDKTFNCVVSNQVFEHVENLDQSLGEISRVMVSGGTLLALFPVKETLWEGHFGLPLIHRMPKQSRFRTFFAKTWFLMGLGYNRKGKNASEWAEYACNYVDKYTTYRGIEEITETFEKHGFFVEMADEPYIEMRFIRKIVKVLPFCSKIFNSDLFMYLFRKFYLVRGGVVILATLRTTKD